MLKVIFQSIIGACMLTSCGLTPVYQNTQSASQSKLKIIVVSDNDNGYTAYKLKKEIETLMPLICYSDPVTIKIRVSENYGNIAFNTNAKAVRGHGQLSAHVQLITNATTIKHEASVQSVTSFTQNYLEEFANISAEAGAREHLIKDLAQEIIRELSVAEVEHNK